MSESNEIGEKCDYCDSEIVSSRIKDADFGDIMATVTIHFCSNCKHIYYCDCSH